MGRFGAVPGFGCCSSFALKRSGRRFGGRAAPRGSTAKKTGTRLGGRGLLQHLSSRRRRKRGERGGTTSRIAGRALQPARLFCVRGLGSRR